MKEKYVKFFKKELIFLLILLVVVCFSFGLTYSNFIYNSDSYRAVEMFTSKLDYELDKNELTIKPGNNLFKINIKSLNNVDSYFKIIYDNNNVNIKYFNNETNIIKANKSLDVNLIVFNNSESNETVNISIIGGFITNEYEDIKVEKNHYEVKENINSGDIITLNNQAFRLLNINNDGSYELISDVLGDKVVINGSNGYNQYISIINNSIPTIEGEINKRVITIEDIEKYTDNKIVEYNTSYFYSNTHYPLLWASEEGSIIENSLQDGKYSKSEGVVEGSYEYASSITIKSININELSFKNELYKDIFTSSNYLIGTRYSMSNVDTVKWGVLSMNDGKIITNELFESNTKDYVVNGIIRVIVNINKNVDLFSKAL